MQPAGRARHNSLHLAPACDVGTKKAGMVVCAPAAGELARPNAILLFPILCTNSRPTEKADGEIASFIQGGLGKRSNIVYILPGHYLIGTWLIFPSA